MMTNLWIDDSKRTKRLNEERVLRLAQKNKKENVFRFESDAFSLVERGAEQLHFALGEEGIISLFEERINSGFIKKRYELENSAKLYNLMDEAPLYSAIHVEFETEGEYYQIVLIKETIEKTENAEFRIPEIRMLFN